MKKKRLKLAPILKKAEQAIKAAVRATLREHKQKGLPIYIMEHNKIVQIPAKQLRV